MRSHDQITDTIVRLIVALEIEPTETVRFDVGYGRLRVWANDWRLRVRVSSMCIPAEREDSLSIDWKLTLVGRFEGGGFNGDGPKVRREIERIEHVLRTFEVRPVAPEAST